MTNDARHLLTAAYSGLALIFMAALASAIRITLNPDATSTGLIVAWASVNLIAWGAGWIALRRESDQGFSQLLIAVGDALLPLNLYMIGITHARPVAGSIAFSASFAAMAALAYYIFADLAARRVPLTGYPHRVYLFTICFAVPVYFAYLTVGLSVSTVALVLVGVVGLVAALSRLLDPPLRQHYAVAGMLLILAVAGLFARPFTQRTDGLFLLGVSLAAGLLFALAWFNREAWFGKLLGFSAWGILTLAFAATFHALGWWRTPSLVLAAAWVALLVYTWRFLGPVRFAPLKEPAYWFAFALGVMVAGSLRPLWRSLAMLHFDGLLRNRFTGVSYLTSEMPPDNLWRALALAVIAIAIASGIIVRRANRKPMPDSHWTNVIDNLIGAVPPLLLLAAISAGTARAFGAVSWVVTLLTVTGAVYCWAGLQFARLYPFRPLTILGYAALALAVITASYHLPTTIFTLAAVAIILFIVSELSQSLTAYVLCLAQLVAEFLLISFVLFPQQSLLALSLSYLLLLLFAYWWVYRAHPRFRIADFGLRISQYNDSQSAFRNLHSAMARRALITLTLTLLLAAFIIGASIVLRQFHPISFLILAATYAPIRTMWETTWQAPARRYAQSLWLVGSELAHVAVGLLMYSALRWFNVRLDFYGIAFAGLSVAYLIGYLASAREPRRLSRVSLMHFVHVFSLAAAVLTILYSPLGIKTILAWLLVAAVHLILSADEETRWIYPVRALRIVGYAAIVVAAVYVLWRNIPGLAVRAPLPDVLTRDTSTLLRASFLLALGVIFTILMNRNKSLGDGLLAIGFITAALALVAFTAVSGSVSLYSSLLYVYLLALSRVELRRTNEAAFNPRLPETILWLANGLLLLLLGMSALQRQFDPLAFIVVTVGFMVLSLEWESMLPRTVRQRLRPVLLTSFAMAHAAAAVAVYAWLRAYGVTLSYYGLAFAVLAGLHLLGYWLAQRQRTAPLREKVLWYSSHLLALISLILTFAFASRSLNSALAALLLALMSLVAHLLSGTAIYRHSTAYFLIAVIAFIGRARGIPVLEFYLVPVAMYLGWVFYDQGSAEERGRGRGRDEARERQGEAEEGSVAPSPPRPFVLSLFRFGLAAGVFILLVAYPAWKFMTTGGVAHLIVSSLGAVAAIHLFVITRVRHWLIYLTGLVLISEAVYIIGTKQFDSTKVGSMIIIGSLIIADLAYLARQKLASNEKDLITAETAEEKTN
ncbi:MAG: hypothetical protein HY314_17085 [Acidobacteria bacterium]|nr:hypothetical protein [Acidobacteriota bacterium]